MNDKQREDFEKWYVGDLSRDDLKEIRLEGSPKTWGRSRSYYSDFTETAWLAWQAAQAAQAAQEPDINAEDVLRISKSGYSIKLGWAEKRIVASAPNNQCTEQWLEDAQKLCDGWNRTSPPNQDALIAELVEALEKSDEAMAWELGGEPLPTLMIEARAKIEQALAKVKERV